MTRSEQPDLQVVPRRRARPAIDVARPRVAPIAAHRTPWYMRLILAAQRRKYGRALAPTLAWARLPRAFLALTLLYRALDRSGARLAPGCAHSFKCAFHSSTAVRFASTSTRRRRSTATSILRNSLRSRSPLARKCLMRANARPSRMPRP